MILWREGKWEEHNFLTQVGSTQAKGAVKWIETSMDWKKNYDDIEISAPLCACVDALQCTCDKICRVLR